MNNWMAVAFIILSLFVGFMLGTAFTYTSISAMLKGAFEGSNVEMNIDLNESEIVGAAYKLMSQQYNFTEDFNELKNISGAIR